MPFKSEKQRKWMWANDPEMAKKWEKEEKMKRETKVKQLIKKMVREMMKEDFAGSYPAHMRKGLDKKRRKQSEVLGYKLTGKDDIRSEIGDATSHTKSGDKYVEEGKLTEDYKNSEWEVYVADENRREKIVKVAKSKRAAVILYNKLIKTDKYHEVGMRVVKEGKLSEASSKVKNQIKKIMKYDHIDDLADYIEQFDIDKKHWKYIGELFNRIRDEVQGMKPSGYADRYRKDLEKLLFKVIKESTQIATLTEDYEVTIEDRKGKKIQGGKFTMKDDAKLYIKDMIKKHKLRRGKGMWYNDKGVELSTNF